MLMRVVIVALLVILAGCSSVSSRDIYLPDGSKGYSITCGGFTYSMEKCFEKAGDICGSKGYSISTTPPGMMLTTSMLIKCKE
jgi:uncharacterized protein YceK